MTVALVNPQVLFFECFSYAELSGQKSTLDWDEPDPVRQKTLQRRFTQDELNELDFAAYLASSESSSFSSSDDDSEVH